MPNPGVRPPLVKGLFAEVDLRDRPRSDKLVIPRHALTGDRVYLIEDGKLAIRPVEVEVMQQEYAVISVGLEARAKVIVSDLAPAIEGMPLQGQMDEDVLQRLRADAGAED